MPSYFDELARGKYLCSPARSFAQIAAQSIFAKITDRTTPEQYQAAQESLRQLCQRYEATLDLFHYPAAYSSPHWCVRDVYTDAAYRLQNLSIMQPVPEPPAPKQQVITVEGVVIDIEETLSTSTTETDLGTKE
jgi:hypothetical protein